MIRANTDSCKVKTQVFQPQINSARFDINYLLDECIFHVMSNLTFKELQNLECTCKRFHIFSKNAPMWLTLHTQMVSLVGLDQLKPKPQNSTYKDIICNALRELKPEALLTKCIFYYDNIYNIYRQRDFTKALEQLVLIKNNEIATTPELKIKIDLLHSELLIFKSEFGAESDDKDYDAAHELIQSIQDSACASEKEKAWATCLTGLLFYYSKEDLVINGDALTDQEISTLLQTVVNNVHALPSHKAIANLYQDLLYCTPLEEDDLTETEGDDFDGVARYEQLHKNSGEPDLPSAYKAKWL